jgi:hypothetical protein
MAVLKGIKEKAHLPLYDSLFVRPRRQLREVESSSVFKFFVNAQGKTRLETNMQSASLLPHWNTFEARALRVVISDLTPRYPAEIEECLKSSADNAGGRGIATPAPRPDAAPVSTAGAGVKLTPQMLDQARERVEAFNAALANGAESAQELEARLGLLRSFCDPQKMGRILQTHRTLRLLRADLAALIRRSKAKSQKLEALNQFADELEAMSEGADDLRFIKQLDEGASCLDAIEKEMAFARHVREISFADVQSALEAAKDVAYPAPPRPELPPRAPLPGRTPADGSPEQILVCLKRRVSDEFRIPLVEQIFGGAIRLFAKLIFNSVTTFFVGEKVMIQAPTWFFPGGGGPYSGNGRVINHGFPSPEATFRFAEPVFIDAQQNFRVEMEIPDAGALVELQRIYGPFFIWVTLDGYMCRDAQ